MRARFAEKPGIIVRRGDCTEVDSAKLQYPLSIQIGVNCASSNTTCII